MTANDQQSNVDPGLAAEVAEEVKKYRNKRLAKELEETDTGHRLSVRETLVSEEDEKRLKESLSLSSLVVQALLNMCIKILMQIIVGPKLQKFPHFQTPLSSISSIKESISNYNIDGNMFA